MNRPTLIRIDKTTPIKDATLYDLRVNQLFSTAVISVLRYPCNKAEILARQGIFHALENDMFFSLMRQCKNAILEYEKACELWKKSDLPVEKVFLQVFLPFLSLRPINL